MDQWISKEEAGDIVIFVSPEVQTPSGLDEELKDALMKADTDNPADLIRSVENLIARGASISRAGAMHIAAANGDRLGPPILRELVRLGGDIDGPDENGNTPLHIAATVKAVSSIEYLLACGASRTRQNDDGNTPLMCSEKALQNTNDFRAAMGMNLAPREMDIIPKYQAMTLLMDQSLRTHLIEGWLSPRMREMLKITAEIEGDQLLHDGDLFAVERFIPTEMRQGGLPAYFITGS
jgi:ankyrin repeat protein